MYNTMIYWRTTDSNYIRVSKICINKSDWSGSV